MPTIDRTDIIRGPAVLNFASQTFYSKGDISLTIEQTTVEKTSDVYGIIGRAVTDRQVKVRFTPVGEIEALTVLYPYGTAGSYALGSSIYGAADTALTITSTYSVTVVLNCAVTQMPSLTLGAGTTAFGECEFTGILKKDGNPNAQTSYFTYAESTQSLPTTMSVATVLSGVYQGTFYGDTVDSISGFTVDFDLSLAPVVADGYGTLDMRIQDVQFTATWEPIGNSGWPNDILTYIGNAPGAELYSSALTIATATTGGISFTADKTTLANIDLMWGAGANVMGPMTVNSHRDVAAGALDNLFAIAVV